MSAWKRWAAPLKPASPEISRSLNQQKQLFNLIFSSYQQIGFTRQRSAARRGRAV